MTNYADYVGELYTNGSIKKFPRKLLRSGQYVTEDKNGLTSVNVGKTEFVMFPAGAFTESDQELLNDVQVWLKAQNAEETPTAREATEKPKKPAPASTD